MIYKFNVGDIVRCTGNGIDNEDEDGGGCGWKKDKLFTVAERFCFYTEPVYFPKNGDGVFESYLTLEKKLTKKRFIINKLYETIL